MTLSGKGKLRELVTSRRCLWTSNDEESGDQAMLRGRPTWLWEGTQGRGSQRESDYRPHPSVGTTVLSPWSFYIQDIKFCVGTGINITHLQVETLRLKEMACMIRTWVWLRGMPDNLRSCRPATGGRVAEGRSSSAYTQNTWLERRNAFIPVARAGSEGMALRLAQEVCSQHTEGGVLCVSTW